MRRRAFLCGSAAMLAAPLAAQAQEAARVPRVGVLHSIPAPATYEAFRRGLQELGYMEEQQVHLEYRWAEGGPEALSAVAAELVQGRFDLILAISSGAARAAKRAKIGRAHV